MVGEAPVARPSHTGRTAPYRFGFILSTLLGNAVRYRNLRKYSENIENVECVWAPVQHYYKPGEHDPVRFLPGPIHTRAVAIAQAWPVLRQMRRFDAVMVHQFEVLNALAARSYVAGGPIIVAAQDMPPVLDRDTYPLYPEQRAKAGWRSTLRLKNDIWTAQRAGYFLGFSPWSTRIVEQCGLSARHLDSIHVGLDLDIWTLPEDRPERGAKTRILHVAGDFERKGGAKLLRLFSERLSRTCELDIVTQSPLHSVPDNVRVHRGLGPGDPALVDLFRRADLFVLPTEADLSPWVALEAMATETAVAISGIGGIPDLVTPETGVLFDPNDEAEFFTVVEQLANDPERCRAMGRAGRRRIEAHFNSAINVPLIFDRMKRWCDERDGGGRAR